jgi:predicted Rossmann-fold nucleotide-binding protein
LGSEFWNGWVDWLKTTVVNEKMISPSDLDLFQITDNPVEAASIIHNFYQNRVVTTNF